MSQCTQCQLELRGPGKSIGCYNCDSEFCSHECLDRHLFILALYRFEEAALALSSAFDNTAPNTAYPFKQSFDELCLAIIEWRHSVESK